MESLNEQLKKIELETAPSAEGILYDVLPQVFKNLNTKDLCRAAGVCTSWRIAVRTEFSKRTIQSLVLKAIDDESEEEEEEEKKEKEEEPDDDHDDDFASYHSFKYSQSKTHWSNYLTNEPCHSLIFCGDKFPADVEAPDRILRRCNWETPASTIAVIEILGASIDETPILESNDNILGIFIPSNGRIKMKAYAPDYHQILEYPDENPILITEILSKLIDDSENHHCMIIFNLVIDDDESERLQRFAKDVLLDLRKRYKSGKFSLWGGSVRSMKSSGSDVLTDVESCWFGMSLTGPTLTSYSIAIDVNLSDSEKGEKLQKFKSSIEMKTNTFAFAFVPASGSDSPDKNISKTKAFRKVFPKLALTSVYNTNNLSQFSINTTNDDLDISFEFMNCIAYLIVTHS